MSANNNPSACCLPPLAQELRLWRAVHDLVLLHISNGTSGLSLGQQRQQQQQLDNMWRNIEDEELFDTIPASGG